MLKKLKKIIDFIKKIKELIGKMRKYLCLASVLVLIGLVIPAFGIITINQTMSDTPTIQNISMMTTLETYVSLAGGTNKVCLQARADVPVRFAFISGATATTWVTIKAGTNYYDENLFFWSGKTIYLLCPTGDTTLEVLSWK